MPLREQNSPSDRSDLGDSIEAVAPGIDIESQIRILHVDDDDSFLDLAETFLERKNDSFEVLTATDAEEGMGSLDDVDCIVSDYDMPNVDGLTFLRRVREDYPDLPFILFTGKGSEEIASEAISAGVTDYIQKRGGSEQYALLANRIENAVSQYRATKQVTRGFQAIETAREGISLLDGEGHFVYVNAAYADIVGYDRDDLLGRHWEFLYPSESVDRVRDEILPSVPVEGRWAGTNTYVREDGERMEVDHALSYTDEGTMICLIREHERK